MTLEIARTLAALLLTLGLLVLALAALKHWAPRLQSRLRQLGQTPARRLTLLETLPLTPRHQAHVVRVDNHEFLAITGPEGSTLQLLHNPSSKPTSAGKVAPTTRTIARRP